jgi:hypothetical protein
MPPAFLLCRGMAREVTPQTRWAPECDESRRREFFSGGRRSALARRVPNVMDFVMSHTSRSAAGAIRAITWRTLETRRRDDGAHGEAPGRGG